MTAPTLSKEAEDIRFRFRDLIAAQLVDGPDQVARIDDPGLLVVQKALDELLDTEAMIEAVDAILVIGHYLEVELKSPVAAQRIVDLVNREVILESMRRIHQARQERDKDRSRQGAEDFNKFAQRSPTIEKVVADPNAEAPSSAVKLNSLAFPKRL